MLLYEIKTNKQTNNRGIAYYIVLGIYFLENVTLKKKHKRKKKTNEKNPLLLIPLILIFFFFLMRRDIKLPRNVRKNQISKFQPAK